MLVAIPFFSDESFMDYNQFAKDLASKGQCDGHALLVVTQRHQEDEAIEFVNSIGKLFSDTHIQVVEAVGGGTAALANTLFKAAVYFFRDYKGLVGQQGHVPMLYLDPTWNPANRGWLDAIQGEYFAKGCPKVLCRWKANDRGEKVSKGPVLFSKEYAVDAPLIPHIPANTHWRDYLRHEIGQVAAASDTISTGTKSVIKPCRSRLKK